LPTPIADELMRNGGVQPKYARSATTVFADIQGFTLLAERTEPARLIDLLDQYFSALDEICARYGLEKVKTNGDAHMAVAGVLAPDRRHLIHVCLAALDMQTLVDRFKARCKTIACLSAKKAAGRAMHGARNSARRSGLIEKNYSALLVDTSIFSP
jgi:adenylate cyclase